MNVYTHNQFTGLYPVPTAAIVIAKDKRQAILLLQAELADISLAQKILAKDLHLVSTEEKGVIILSNGDY